MDALLDKIGEILMMIWCLFPWLFVPVGLVISIIITALRGEDSSPASGTTDSTSSADYSGYGDTYGIMDMNNEEYMNHLADHDPKEYVAWTKRDPSNKTDYGERTTKNHWSRRN